MRNSAGAQDLFPPRRNDELLREFMHGVGGGVPDIFMRGGMTYLGSSLFLRSFGMSPGYAAPIAIALTALEVGPDVINLLRQTGRRMGGIPQHSLHEAVPGEENYSVIYNKIVRYRSQYTFRHRDERYTFTGIACLHLSTEMQSPEAEVVEGGVNHSYVTIRLTPEKEYEYGCRIIIVGKERQPDCPQRSGVSDLSQQMERMRRKIPQHSLTDGTPGEEKYPTIREKKILRRSPFTFRHRDEQYTITGIACLPLSTEMQSPEAEVVEGGVNHSYVSIRLTPEEEGQYGCRIIITGKERQPDCPQR